jgi:flagellar biogenesis protein FliO
MSGTGTGVASYGDLLVTSLVVLAGVCIAAFVIVRVFGRVLATGRVRGAHLLDVVARVPLEPRRSLYVVEVAGKTLLVGTSEMGLSVLSELDGAEVRARVVERPSFGELVKQAWARRKGLTRTGSASGVGDDDRSSHVGGDESKSHVGRTEDTSARRREMTTPIADSSGGVETATAETSGDAGSADKRTGGES